MEKLTAKTQLKSEAEYHQAVKRLREVEHLKEVNRQRVEQKLTADKARRATMTWAERLDENRIVVASWGQPTYANRDRVEFVDLCRESRYLHEVIAEFDYHYKRTWHGWWGISGSRVMPGYDHEPDPDAYLKQGPFYYQMDDGTTLPTS
jgi:hypothetical protein